MLESSSSGTEEKKQLVNWERKYLLKYKTPSKVISWQLKLGIPNPLIYQENQVDIKGREREWESGTSNCDPSGCNLSAL